MYKKDKSMQHTLKALFMGFVLSQQMMNADEILIQHVPVAMVYNPGPKFSLINSIEHHPKENLFCVTYTHNNKIIFYQMNASGKPERVQILGNPEAKLSEPQHAAFSPDGKKIVVANWQNQKLAVYKRKKNGRFREKPVKLIPAPSALKNHKPHGVAFSPCGNYLAIAYGSSSDYDKGLALYAVKGKFDLELIHLFQDPQQLPGIPKGITFSPDGTSLLVTFSDLDAFFIYNLSTEKNAILDSPRQMIQGEETGLSRPEDIKISPNGNYCAVSNSDRDTITFYPYDKTLNRVTQNTPLDILQNPEACLCFPHGITFSPDGLYMLVTEFGRVDVREKDIVWDQALKPEASKFNLYRLLNR